MNTNCLSDTPTSLAFATTAGANSSAAVNHIILAKEGLWSSPIQHAGVLLRVVEGTVWITAHGDPHDYIVREGQSFRSTGHKRVVVQSLCDRARMMVES